MLNAVDGDRPVAAGDVQDALDPQQIVAVERDQHLDPVGEFRPVQRRLAAQAEGADAGVVAIGVERVLDAVLMAHDDAHGSWP